MAYAASQAALNSASVELMTYCDSEWNVCVCDLTGGYGKLGKSL